MVQPMADRWSLYARHDSWSAARMPRLPASVALCLLCGCGATQPTPQEPAPAVVIADPVAPATGSSPVSLIDPEPVGHPVPNEPPTLQDLQEPPPYAEKTPSGLVSAVIRPGTGRKHPGPESTVRVHYTGWTTDGTMFDSSVERGQPASFPLRAVIAGWAEGAQLMVEGEKRRIWIPEDLAYKGSPGRPAGILVFDVELLEIVEPPQAPPDVANPPPNGRRTASGLVSKVLRAGTGTTHPTATSRVEVHYTGWTTDGNMFDSSVARGQPAQFPLNGVIPGWTEGVQLMVEGEKRRLWIPEDLAYKGRGSAPQGTLVFDIELLRILP
jgi:FKBP-type peptidyl-prolyl cis-trans isomerase